MVTYSNFELQLDEYQNLKISDFGLSREVEVEMTLAGICNPRWRPPEITKGVTTYDGKVYFCV
jgi:serine/threonine protein kinase